MAYGMRGPTERTKREQRTRQLLGDALLELKIARQWLGSGLEGADDPLDQEVWERLNKTIKRIEAAL